MFGPGRRVSSCAGDLIGIQAASGQSRRFDHRLGPNSRKPRPRSHQVDEKVIAKESNNGPRMDQFQLAMTKPCRVEEILIGTPASNPLGVSTRRQFHGKEKGPTAIDSGEPLRLMANWSEAVSGRESRSRQVQPKSEG